MKSKNYSKIIIVFVLLAIYDFSFGQISSAMLDITKPNPSISNLMNFVDIPVNTHTGIPNIDVPLINIPTTNKDCNVRVALSYHPAGNAFTNSASDVGVGWNLIAGGVISRTVANYPDEYLRNLYIGLGWPIAQIVFNDVYSYNFMGYTGKFKINYDQLNNTAVIEKLEINNLKITCTMGVNSQAVASFTVYDDDGLKYIFNVRDRNNASCIDIGQQQFILNMIYGMTELAPLNILSLNYVSAYHLSEVYDANNVKLINCSFTTHVIPNPGIGPTSDKVTNKLNILESVNYGTILFDYVYSAALETTLNDPFALNEISLKNKKNELINKYKLNYDVLYIKKERRYLSKLEKFDVGTQSTQDYIFEYHNYINNTSPFYCDGTEDFFYGTDKFGYLNLTGNPWFTAEFDEYITDGMFYEDFNERTSKDACLYGVLTKISYPTGGMKEFEFESNTFRYFQNLNAPIPTLQVPYEVENTDNHVYTQIHNADYSTINGICNVPLIISGTEPVKLFIKLYPVAYYSSGNFSSNEPMYALFQLLGNGPSIVLQRTTPTCLGHFIELVPGSYTIQVSSTENSIGSIIITKKNLTSQPIKQFVYGGGLRIKKITDKNLLGVATPDREVNYEYGMFDNSNLTSGELYDGFYRSFATKRATAPQVSYKNIKIYNTQNNGYTKHTYESYTDTPYFMNSLNVGYFPKYFGYKNGLLKKVEIFDRYNNLLQETNNEYELTESGTFMYINSMLDYNFGWFFARPCWSKLISKTDKEYFYTNNQLSGTIEGTKTFTYNNANYKIAQETVVTANNETLSTKYYYPSDLGNVLLLNKNIIGAILKTEAFRNNEKLSTQENVYKDWGSGFIAPELVKAAKGTNALEVRVKYNKIDLSNGNPEEVQQESGIKTSYIWGYNKTYPVAKIDNSTYNAIPVALISAIQTASNGTDENALIQAFENLRIAPAMLNAMITTYTYKPLVGISTVTDAKGDKMTYYYDGFNRLKEVRDKNGNILSQNQYHYRTQN